MNSSIEQKPLLLPCQLARKIGRSAALVIQQIHYWLQRSKHLIGGVRWIYNSFTAWAEQLPISDRTIQRAIAKLKKHQLIKVERWAAQEWDQTNWYTIDYQRLEELKALNLSITPNCLDPDCQTDAIEVDKMTISYTEISTEEATTTDKPTHPPVVGKNQNLGLLTKPTPVEKELAKETPSDNIEPEQAKPLGLNSNTNQTSLKTPTPNQNDQLSAEAAKEFFEEIEAAGIQLNATLTKLVCSATAQVITDALETLKEGLVAGRVQRPAAFLHNAIKGQWKPSRVEDPRAPQKAPANFSEWFNLAKEAGIATASIRNPDGFLTIYTPDSEVHPWEVMLAAHPLEELQSLVELKRQHDRKELSWLYPTN